MIFPQKNVRFIAINDGVDSAQGERLFAAVIGSIAGYICTIFVEAATTDTIQLVAVPIVPMIEATVFAFGVCLLATCIPLRRISRMSIVDSIEAVE